MRSVFLPPELVAGASRAAPGTCRPAPLVMTVWLVVGLVLATRTFRWVVERRA